MMANLNAWRALAREVLATEPRAVELAAVGIFWAAVAIITATITCAVVA